ncbi:MAG: hypothetical protein AAB733_02320 [Patescibacteria group bacterium]
MAVMCRLTFLAAVALGVLSCSEFVNAWSLPHSPYADNWIRLDGRVMDQSYDLWYFYDGGQDRRLNLLVDGGVNISEGFDGSVGLQSAWLDVGHGGWAAGSADLYLCGGVLFGDKGSNDGWALLNGVPQFYAFYVSPRWDCGNWTNVFLDATGEGLPVVWWNRTYASTRLGTDHFFLGPGAEWERVYESAATTNWLLGARGLVKIMPDQFHLETFGYRDTATTDAGLRVTLLVYAP